uniref:N-acetyltransferase n=1 Tax=Thermosporothrix sp. COM3 TaxID=2490863 RepID=A0A455SE06_9CHLR|nr:N-acetyltransferase [Thermosporothrix sp. COM3]
MHIRSAKKEDSIKAAQLIYSAYHEIANLITGEDDEHAILATLQTYFEQDVNRLSYRNTLVAEVDGQVAGILIAYHGSDELQLDVPIERYLQQKFGKAVTLPREAEDDEFYVDALAVDPAFSGRGIGTALLTAVEKLAQERGYSKLSLNVELSNEGAHRLYRKAGYQEHGTWKIGKDTFWHMLKLVESGA